VTGGLAGDGDKFKKTWVIFDGNIHTNAIVGVGFYGDKIHIVMDQKEAGISSAYSESLLAKRQHII